MLKPPQFGLSGLEMSVRNLRNRWENAEGWMRCETGGREGRGGVDSRFGNSKTTLTISHCDKEVGGAWNIKSSLSSSNDSLPSSSASSPKSVLKKTSTVGSMVRKKGQSSSGRKHHGTSGGSVHFEEEGGVKGGDLFPCDDDEEDRRLSIETTPRVLDMYTSDDEVDEATSLAATTRAIYIGGLGEERNRKNKSDKSDISSKYFGTGNVVNRHDREEKNSVERCSTFSPSSTSKQREKHSRNKSVMSVMDRVKMFSAMSENEVMDVSGSSDDDEKIEKNAKKRGSFKKLAKGAVSNLRDNLAGTGFDPSTTPGYIEDMINRGEKGDIKCNITNVPSNACYYRDNKGRGEDIEVGGRGYEEEDDGVSGIDIGEGESQDDMLMTLSLPSQNGNKNHSRTSSQFVGAQQEILSLRVHQWEGTVEHHRAAVRLQTLARVMIARSAIRRKLVSEVTAFSIIAERGISMMKHPFHGRHRPKPVTVCISNQKEEVSVVVLRCLFISKTLHPCWFCQLTDFGLPNPNPNPFQLHLTWGGKNSVALHSIYGIVKGRETKAMRRSADESASDRCFSLLVPNRTVDMECNNPWLALLIVRALRLYLRAHYNTLPTPKFYSPLSLGQGRGNRLRYATCTNPPVGTGNNVENRSFPKAEPPLLLPPKPTLGLLDSPFQRIQQTGTHDGSFSLCDDDIVYDESDARFRRTREPTAVRGQVEPSSQADNPITGKTASQRNHARTLSPTSALKGKSFDFMTLPGTPTSSKVNKSKTFHGFSTGSESLADDYAARRKNNILRYSI